MAGSNNKGFFKTCNANGVGTETSGTEVELDFSTITTGTGMSMSFAGLTTGTGLEIAVDSDVVTTGKAIEVLSGSAMTTSVFSVNEDGDVVAAGTIGGSNAVSAAFTVATETGNTITVSVQLNDAAGTACAKSQGLYGYIASDTGGMALDTAPSGGVAAGTDGMIIETLADQGFWCVSEADGDIDIVLTETGTGATYLALILPNGDITVSGAITFT